MLPALLTILVGLQSVRAQGTAADARREREETERAALIGRLGKEWKTFEVAPFLVCSEGQDAFARETAVDAAVLWKWMAETFASFAPESYAPAPLLCVHATEEGARVDGYVEGGYVFAGEGPYLLAIYPAPFLQSNVRRRVGEAWFQAKDRDAYFALPGWMRAGFVEMFADARTKGGKAIFKSDTNTLNDFAAALREGRLVPLRKFLRAPMPRDASQGEGHNRRFSPSPQAGQLLRYLLVGKGARGVKTRKILPDYFAAVAEQVPALSKDVDAALEARGVERSAASYSETRALEFEKLEARSLPGLFERVFAGWTDKDWDALTEGYLYDKL
jgi:hypothetical protein